MRSGGLIGALVVGALLFGAPVTAQVDASSPARPSAAVIEPIANETPVDHPWQACDRVSRFGLQYYPMRAQRLGIEGSADIECRLPAKASKFTACAWIADRPANFGFGESAAKLACLFRVPQAMLGEQGAQDRIYKNNIVFRLGGNPAR